MSGQPVICFNTMAGCFLM